MNTLISKEMAMDKIMERANKVKKPSPYWEGLMFCKNILNKLPSIYHSTIFEMGKTEKLIDRKQAIIAVRNNPFCVYKLRRLPIIEINCKIGQWINVDDHVICSNCGAIHYGVDKNFCPNCGADMRDKRLNKMSGGITVKEFKHIPGVNDAEYIKKLEELHEIDKGIISKAVAKIKMLSAQPERPKGRWIPTASEKGRHECSRCHEYAPCYQDGSEHLSTFCVLCGAKMEEDDEQK